MQWLLASMEFRHLGFAFPLLIFCFSVSDLNLMKMTLKNWTSLLVSDSSFDRLCMIFGNGLSFLTWKIKLLEIAGHV